MLTRGRHSSRTVSEIRRKMTDIMVDLYSDFGTYTCVRRKTGEYTRYYLMPHTDDAKKKVLPCQETEYWQAIFKGAEFWKRRGHTTDIDSWIGSLKMGGVTLRAGTRLQKRAVVCAAL